MRTLAVNEIDCDRASDIERIYVLSLFVYRFVLCAEIQHFRSRCSFDLDGAVFRRFREPSTMAKDTNV